MKSALLFPAIAAVAFLAGCINADKLNSIRIGMTKDEVIAIMGKPDSMSAQANVEYLTYYLYPNQQYGRDQPYLVRLVDNKVESFGRFSQLVDLYDRPVTNARPGDPNFPQATPFGTAVIATPGATPAPAGPDLVGEIERLKALKDQGVLTEEEFEKAKAKLLSDQK